LSVQTTIMFLITVSAHNNYVAIIVSANNNHVSHYCQCTQQLIPTTE